MSVICNHTLGGWWEYDVQGIPLAKVCDKCRAARLRGYRPEVLDADQREAAGYGRAEPELSYAEVIEEPIEPEDA